MFTVLIDPECYLFPVKEGPATLDGRVGVADHRSADNSKTEFPVDGKSHGDAGQRIAVDKVHGAIDWVDDPGGIVAELRQL